MATSTFTTAGVNNLWSNAANWSAGVPANSDTAVIPVGQTCEFDADQSGFAAGVTVQLAGTLEASTTAGSYVLKLAANMTGSGTFKAGTSTTVFYPDDCVFQVSRGTNEVTAGSMTLGIFCSEPAVKWVKLTAQAAIGATTLYVDTDLTPYVNHWKANNLIRVCDVNYGNDNEERTISSITSTTIVITSGLTAQKEVGAYVALVSRNVKIVGSAATGNAINGGTGGKINAEIRTAAVGVNVGTSHAVGGTVSNCPIGFSGSSNGHNLSGLMLVGNTIGVSSGLGASIASCLIAGNSNGFSSSIGAIIDSTTIITGNNSGLATCNTFRLFGTTITGNANGVDRSSVNAYNATFGNTNDLVSGQNSFFYNCMFSGTTEDANYNTAAVNIANFVESINHDQVAGAFKAWTRGGIVTKTASPAPTGYDYSYDHACESATYYVFQNFTITVPAGGGLVVQCEMRKDASMSYLPRVWILLPGVEPFISGSPSYEAIMTNSVDTWETLVLVYANSTTAPVTVTVRTVAQNATGHVYTYPINTVLAPATYDVYSTLQSDLDDIQSRIPATLVSGRMDSYAGAIAAGVVTTIQSGLSTLTAQQVWEYGTRTLSSFGTLVSDIVTGLTTGTYQGRAYRDIWLDVWKQVVGDFVADDVTNPTTITYQSSDESTQLVHTITDTTREWSETP